MALFYEDLIEPTIVKQVTKQVAYCRCTRSKNLPFCDGSHAATNISPRVLEGECTPRKEFVLKQLDTVMLESGQSYQLCNTGTGRLLLLGAGNAGVNGVPRSRVPGVASHTPVQQPVVV